MKTRSLNLLTLAVMAAVSISSCIKDEITPLTTEGAPLLKLSEASENKVFLSPYSGVKTVSLFTVGRDAANNAQLNTPLTVKLTSSSTAITDYNTAHSTDYEVLPDSLFTLGSGISREGNIWTVPLTAGEFAKGFDINLNGSKWNLSKKYALAFTITDSAGIKIASGKKDIIVLVAVKNKYDGVYTVTGEFSDVTNPAFVSAYPLEWELQTTGVTQCKVVDNVNFGIPAFLFYTGTAYSGYGSFGLLVNFDPATDKITSVTNFYGQPASNTRSAELDPSGANKYDASTKTISIKYYMKQPSVVAAPPNIRCYFNETWKFKRDR